MPEITRRQFAEALTVAGVAPGLAVRADRQTTAGV
jgi:hypothetical protein